MFSSLVIEKNSFNIFIYRTLRVCGLCCAVTFTLQGRLINVKVNPDNFLVIVMWDIFRRNPENTKM